MLSSYMACHSISIIGHTPHKLLQKQQGVSHTPLEPSTANTSVENRILSTLHMHRTDAAKIELDTKLQSPS